MDVKIENIIEKIKKEGVEEAQKTSEDLLQKAKKEAAEIVADAKKEADKIIENAQKKEASFEENSRLAIRQAARDGELLLKGRIQALFDRVFRRETGETLKPDFMLTLINKIVDQWSGKAETEVTLSEADLKSLEKLLSDGVKKELKSGIQLKAAQDMEHGFRIGLKGEDVYYDFSDESIAEILKIALNPRIKEMLETNNG